ncbi:MAG TPA: beta-galactosidase, partial [Micromonosporaceae bacterium]
MDNGYVTDPAPGTGYLPARATLDTDRPSLSLNGAWQFRLGGGDAWSRITVPGHWQLQGYGRPAYTNVSYPFPIDPPYVPDENPVGEYRLEFDLPEVGEPARLRFDGVDSCFAVWCNGTRLG